MASPVRMPAGINNVNYTAATDVNGETNYNGARNSHPLFMFPQPDPFRLIMDYSDFTTSPLAGQYTTTVVGTGTAAGITGVGGLYQLATSAGATDSVSVQDATPNFAFAGTTQGWFHTLITPSDATSSELLVGMLNSTTTPLTATDGFYFHKSSGGTAVDLVIKNAGVATTTAHIADMANATAIKLSLYYDGRGTLNYYVNNVKVGIITDTTTFPLATVVLGTTFFILNAAAAIKTLVLDYYMAAAESTR